MIDGIDVRAPRPDDAPEMGRIHVEAWQVGYLGLMPDDVLDALDPGARARWWHDLLTSSADDSTTAVSISIVAELDGRVAGIATYGHYRHDEGETHAVDEAEGLSELWMLNVDPPCWGAGVAQRLNACALDGLGRLFPGTTAVLWVLEGNRRGRRFYEKEGWQPDGRVKVDEFAGVALTELRYSIAL